MSIYIDDICDVSGSDNESDSMFVDDYSDSVEIPSVDTLWCSKHTSLSPDRKGKRRIADYSENEIAHGTVLASTSVCQNDGSDHGDSDSDFLFEFPFHGNNSTLKRRKSGVSYFPESLQYDDCGDGGSGSTGDTSNGTHGDTFRLGVSEPGGGPAFGVGRVSPVRGLGQPLNVNGGLSELELRRDGVLTSLETTNDTSQFSAWKLLVTYPQNSMKKEVMLQRVRAKHEKNLKSVVVCEEVHEEGREGGVGVHLHVFAWFDDCAKHTRVKWNKFGDNKGVNLQRVRKGDLDTARVIAYVCKENNFVAWPEGFEKKWIELAVAKKVQKKPFDTIAKLITDGMSVEEVIEGNPGFALQHLNKIQAFHMKISDMRERKLSKLPFDDGIFKRFIPDLYLPFHAWFRKNFFEPSWEKNCRPIREPNMWFKTSPQVGKTTFISHLDKYLRIYFFPTDSGWHDLYEDGKYDIIVIDEFHGGITVKELKDWTSGGFIPLSRRGKNPIVKRDNLPVLICTNYTIGECYKNLAARGDIALQAIETRFVHMDVRDEPGGLAKLLS